MVTARKSPCHDRARRNVFSRQFLILYIYINSHSCSSFSRCFSRRFSNCLQRSECWDPKICLDCVRHWSVVRTSELSFFMISRNWLNCLKLCTRKAMSALTWKDMKKANCGELTLVQTLPAWKTLFLLSQCRVGHPCRVSRCVVTDVGE